jgi:hypothetical protein
MKRQAIEPSAVYESEDPDSTDLSVLDIKDHMVVFYDGHFLKFDITINENLDLVFYAFHHAAIGGTPMMRRACKNDHRVGVLGSQCHVHIGTDDHVLPAREIDLDGAIQAVHDRTVPGL